MKSIDDHLFSTNYQKILRYLASRAPEEKTEKEIQEAVGVSRAGANLSLRALAADGLVHVEKKGKTAFYSVDPDDPLIRQLKVILNLIEVRPLIQSLSGLSQKIILFGSKATGEDTEGSDVDLFVLTNKPSEVLKIINESESAEKVQAVIKKPGDYLSLKKKDPFFYEEISRGLLLLDNMK